MSIDDNGLLQANATVIAGVLILLTIAAAEEGLTKIVSNFFTLAFTVVAIFPFAVSSTYIIDSKQADEKAGEKEKMMKNSLKARRWTISGFFYVITVVIIIVVTNMFEWVGPVKTFNGTWTSGSIAMHCTKNITVFNVTHLSDCSKFTPGSIAEDCASRPRLYNLDLNQCSQLLGQT